MVRDDISIDPQELDQFEEGAFTDAEMEQSFGIPMSLDEEIPPKISDGIASLLEEYDIKTQLKDAISYKLRELYPYLLLSDEELQHRYSLEKDGEIGHWKKLEKKIQQLLADSYLCKFMNISIAAAEAKLAGVQQFLTEHKEKGKSSTRKILYPILGGIWALLAENEDDRQQQVEFVYKFCVLSEFRSFGNRHVGMEPVLEEDLRAFRREDIDMVEEWYDASKPFMTLPFLWGA